MTCQTVMQTEPVTLPETATLGQALDLLFERRIKTVPMVDGSRRYKGLFGIYTLLPRLLPRAATLGDAAELTDLTFVKDSLDNLRARLDSHLGEPALGFAEPAFPPLSPNESLAEVLLLLHRHRHLLPVVDPDGGRLLGIVTYWGIVAKLTGRAV